MANFFRTLVLPDEVERWSLTTLREKVVKIGAKVIAHARYTVFQMAEVAVPRDLFRRILAMIDELRPKRILITYEPQPISGADTAWAWSARWPSTGAGSWRRDCIGGGERGGNTRGGG